MGALAQGASHTSASPCSALVRQNAHIVLGSLAPSTLETYNKVIGEFRDFIPTLDDGLNVFPVSPAHVSLFMCHLFNLGQAPSTIATKISAIGF